MSPDRDSSQYAAAINGLLLDHGTLNIEGLSMALLQQALDELLRNGISPSPLLLGEFLHVATCSRFIRSSGTKRAKSSRIFDRLRELHDALGQNAGVRSWKHANLKERRAMRVELFLGFFFAGAPMLNVGPLRLIELEVMALSGASDVASAEENTWLVWRAATERSLIANQNSRFTQAIVQLRQSGSAGFTTSDEGIWHVKGNAPTTNVQITASSHQGSGEDKELYRDLRGPFEELGGYTIPPDPSRLVITDLALMSSPKKAARSVIASKIADGTLTVRFGQVQRPARRRARCLLIVTLADGFVHHRQCNGQYLPSVDNLREILIYALPLVVRCFAKQSFATAIELRRDGVFQHGKHRHEDVCARNGGPLTELATSESIRGTFSTIMPWMLEDSYMRLQADEAPNTQGFDECFVLALGGRPQWVSQIEPLILVALNVDTNGSRELSVEFRNSKSLRSDVSEITAKAMGPLLVRGFGINSDEFEQQSGLLDNWEGTVLT